MVKPQVDRYTTGLTKVRVIQEMKVVKERIEISIQTINWPPPVSTSSWAKREKKVKGHLIPYPVRPVAPDRLIEVKKMKNNSLELRKRKTANVNFVSRDQVFPSLVVYCSLLPQKGCLFHASLIHKNCFELFCLRIFYFEKFSTWVWRLP